MPGSRQVVRVFAVAHSSVSPSTKATVSTPGIPFRGSIDGLCTPLPTLRRYPRERLRTAWGRCGLLPLHRKGLHPLLLAGLPALRLTGFSELHGVDVVPRPSFPHVHVMPRPGPGSRHSTFCYHSGPKGKGGARAGLRELVEMVRQFIETSGTVTRAAFSISSGWG
jgi:hypothetical protein